MQGLYSILLLIISNIFMTFAWYGHLKLQEMKIISNWPLIGVILLSWGIALAEYMCQVPANRLGFQGNGGPFSLMQLKVVQEVITLIIFTLFSTLLFKGESLHWNQEYITKQNFKPHKIYLLLVFFEKKRHNNT